MGLHLHLVGGFVFTAVGCRFHFPCRQDGEIAELLRNDMSSLTSSDNDSVPMQQVRRATGLPSAPSLYVSSVITTNCPFFSSLGGLSESDPKWFVLY